MPRREIEGRKTSLSSAEAPTGYPPLKKHSNNRNTANARKCAGDPRLLATQRGPCGGEKYSCELR